MKSTRKSTGFIGFSLAVIVTLFFSTNIIYARGDDYSNIDGSYKTALDDMAQDKTSADGWHPVYSHADGNGFYFGISGGVSFFKPENNQVLTNPDAGGHIYAYDFFSNKYNPGFIFGINGGYEFYLTDNILLDLGIASYISRSSSGAGKISEDALGNNPNTITTFDYSYNITSMQAMVESKLKYKIKRFLPFIALGIGSAWNRVSNFSAQAIDDPQVIFEPFGSKQKINFTYQLGAGVDYLLFAGNYKHYIGVSYRYINLGRENFNLIQDSRYKVVPSGKARTHNIIVQYTYCF